MEIQKLAVREQIVKTVAKSGNGGAVWVPKGWLGHEVIVILPEKPELKPAEKIIHLLEPHLKDIMSVGIYGSHARDEHTKDSDLDVLVITKDKNLRLNFKEEKIEITSFPIDKFKKAIEKYPAIYYQMVQEVKPLINGDVFEELKKISVTKESLKHYLTETREHIESSRELLELDKIDNVYLKSYSVLYSSMLRLRGLFIMECMLSTAKFSNKKFKNRIISLGLGRKEFENCHKAYRLIRDNMRIKSLKIRINVAEKTLGILEKETGLVEAQINGR
ncbi:nucleotidyltransferase domain-containing protein [Candidatus Woesearchaeota archaeon]|nr:nucleotidyltransferase domain-containing protein [Candidatus Woesearchaeota archaeon]